MIGVVLLALAARVYREGGAICGARSQVVGGGGQLIMQLGRLHLERVRAPASEIVCLFCGVPKDGKPI